MIHYIIARRDLYFTTKSRFPKEHGGSVLGSQLGVTAAQVTHAAGESYADFGRLGSDPTDPMIAVVLGVPNQRSLQRLERRLKKARIPHVAIREPDEPWNGQLMTIGLWPCERDGKASRMLRRFKLL